MFRAFLALVLLSATANATSYSNMPNCDWDTNPDEGIILEIKGKDSALIFSELICPFEYRGSNYYTIECQNVGNPAAIIPMSINIEPWPPKGETMWFEIADFTWAWGPEKLYKC